MTEQPDQIDDDDDMPSRMLEIGEVLRIVPVSRTTLLTMEAEGRFPRGKYISANRKAWRAKDIKRWQENLPDTPTGKRLGRPPRRISSEGMSK